MKKNILISLIVLAAIVTCAFAFSKKATKGDLRAMTVVMVHTFTPHDKTKPVLFSGLYVESYKEDGSFVHRKISSKGRNTYFYSGDDGVYESQSATQTAVRAGSHWKPSKMEVETKDAALSTMTGFKAVETIHGLKLSLVEDYPEGKLRKQWWSSLYGPLQVEREVNDGIEQIKIVSVTDGYNPDEFARIPDYPKAPKQ